MTITWRQLPLFIGGLMGPFGTIVILPMFPELRDSFDASSRAVSWGFTAYMLPFAALLLVSGTLGERWGRQRTVRWTYLAYTAASILCAVAPNLSIFLLGRVLQGTANAFITPLLIAGLAEVVAPERFGRALGIYSSFQALGSGLAPLLGGLAADYNWRWAFFGTATISGLLALAPPEGEPRPSEWPPIKPLLTRRMLILGAGALAGAAGPLGLSVLVGVAARDEFNVSGTVAGLILLGGAASAMLCGPLWGKVTDQLGLRTTGLLAATAVTALSFTVAFATTPAALAVLWALTGALVGLNIVAIQGLGATVVPGNRGGALSFVLSFRFVGHAVGPLIFLPIFDVSVRWAFIGAALLGLVTLWSFAQAGQES